MPTTYQGIRNIIQTKLEAVSDIQEVVRYPKLQFDGYPSVVIVPADGESDYETNTEDQRNYVFDLFIYYEYKETTKDTALDRLFDVIDDILDAFAEDRNLTGLSLPAGKSLITTRPVAAGWEELSDNHLLQARIRVEVLVSVDIS